MTVLGMNMFLYTREISSNILTAEGVVGNTMMFRPCKTLEYVTQLLKLTRIAVL